MTKSTKQLTPTTDGPSPIPEPGSTQTRTVKAHAVVPELLQALAAYLSTKPLNEVENLVVGLRNAPLIDVTVTDGKPN